MVNVNVNECVLKIEERCVLRECSFCFCTENAITLALLAMRPSYFIGCMKRAHGASAATAILWRMNKRTWNIYFISNLYLKLTIINICVYTKKKKLEWKSIFRRCSIVGITHESFVPHPCLFGGAEGRRTTLPRYSTYEHFSNSFTYRVRFEWETFEFAEICGKFSRDE